MIAFLFATASFGCGGLFCNTINYDETAVSQAAEEILFAVDAEAGTVTTQVKIYYEGPVDSFAWVVPVPGEPVLSVGSNATFDALRQVDASFGLIEVEEGCGYGGTATGTPTSTPDSWGNTTTSGTSGSQIPGVEVVNEATVGPYETVTLLADDSTALTAWLSVNDYAIGPGFDPATAPYVARGQYFVAMKLAKDRDIGDLEPIAMTYPSTQAGIPLTLTSVAALPDMRLRVYVLGAHRAVPENYLHVQVNPFAVDWWQDGANWEDAVSRAADEAGGQAFATDFVGSGAQLGGSVYRPAWDDAGLAEITDAYTFLVRLAQLEVPLDNALQSVLEYWIPVDPQLAANPESVYSCPACYSDELQAMAVDGVGAAADVEAWVFLPRREARELLEAYPVLTRLTSSASPNEMTLDPRFTFNPDMPQQLGSHRQAVLTIECDGGERRTSPRSLEVPGGLSAALPSEAALVGAPFDFLEPLHTPAALVIERTSSSGQPEVLVDNSDAFDVALDDFNEDVQRVYGGGKGCGCSQAGPSGAALAFLLVPLLFRRRR